MMFSSLQTMSRSALALVMTVAAAWSVSAQTSQVREATVPGGVAAITVERQAASEVMTSDLPESARLLASRAPANFHFFRTAKVGELGDAERVTLRFAESTKLTGITASADFRVEQGSSCVEGNAYAAGGSCLLLVRFRPQGAGQRSGKIAIAHTGSATPFYVGLGGYGYGPIVSFTPSVISTVAGTYPSNKGLLSGASNVAVDGGDTLYVADTGNNAVRYLNAGGTFQNIFNGFGYAAPIGVAVDDFGVVFSTQDSPDLFYTVTYGTTTRYQSYGSACATGTTCQLGTFTFYTPRSLAYDRNGNVFANVYNGVLRLSSGGNSYENATPLAVNYNYTVGAQPLPIAVDTSDTVYTFYQYNGTCLISSESYYSASNNLNQNRKVAGGSGACGFGGDGGPARNALISTTVGQMAFDIAGNLYFSDTGNQRVRRIDASTGIVNTIAGTGAAGYNGDGNAATSAALSSPTGVGVDSQGQVYIVSGAAATGTVQVIRKVGTTGLLNFGNQLRATASATKFVTVANTGNADLTLLKASISGANASDYTIDASTTNCNLAAGAVLSAGTSCKVGIIFQPGAVGARAASLVMLDNSVNGSNTVNFLGSGVNPTATMTITTPTPGTSVTAGTSVYFKVTVGSTTTPAPTGTVKFTLNGAAYGSPSTITGGAATITFTGLATGTQTLGAIYNGDGNFAVTGPVTVAVTVTAAAKVPATVTLKSLANPASACAPVVFSAAVAGRPSAKFRRAANATGQVHLMEGKTELATATIQDGLVTLTVPALSAGSHLLVADYSGDGGHFAATSTPLHEVVAAGGSCVQTAGERSRGGDDSN